MTYSNKYLKNKWFFNTDDSDLSTNNKFHFILEGDHMKFEQFKVESCSFPLSFYYVSGNVHFETPASGDTTTALTTGNYTAAQLAAHLQTIMAASDASITVAYDINTLKITFAATTSIIIYGDGTANKFYGASTITTAAVTPNVMPDVVDIQPRGVYLNSDTLCRNDNLNQKNNDHSVIARIGIDQNMSTLVHWINVHIHDWYDFYSGTISDIDFYLTDRTGEVLDLNGLPFEVTLGLKYKSNYPKEIFKLLSE